MRTHRAAYSSIYDFLDVIVARVPDDNYIKAVAIRAFLEGALSVAVIITSASRADDEAAVERLVDELKGHGLEALQAFCDAHIEPLH